MTIRRRRVCPLDLKVAKPNAGARSPVRYPGGTASPIHDYERLAVLDDRFGSLAGTADFQDE
jgi:hypothetical protein